MRKPNAQLCRKPIKFSGPVVLGIHSSISNPDAEYTDGHAWITVDSKRGRVYLGLWPDGHPRALNHDPECTDVRIGLEDGIPSAASRYYRLNTTQVSKLNRVVNRPDIWGYLNTCARWASIVIEEVLGISIDAVDYVLFSTPRELGRHILELEKKHPTTHNFPNTDPRSDEHRSSSW